MVENYTRENYIVVNKTKYYTGTVFIIDFCGKVQEAAFVCSIPKTNRVLCKLSDKRWWINTDDFRKRIVDITNKVDPSVRMPVTKTMKDSEIDGLFIGWLWYIFLMAISTIFKDAIGLWIFISVVFFNWRTKKIKEEGTYIEW
jgi:hypothetical protein